MVLSPRRQLLKEPDRGSYLLFIDESERDRQESHYEVLAGVATRDRNLWELVRKVQRAELECFGRRYTPDNREAKAKALLKRKTFRLAGQLHTIDPRERRELARGCLEQGSTASMRQLTALGQAKLEFVRSVLELCASCQVRAFASIVPRDAPRPASSSRERTSWQNHSRTALRAQPPYNGHPDCRPDRLHCIVRVAAGLDEGAQPTRARRLRSAGVEAAARNSTRGSRLPEFPGNSRPPALGAARDATGMRGAQKKEKAKPVSRQSLHRKVMVAASGSQVRARRRRRRGVEVVASSSPEARPGPDRWGRRAEQCP